MKRESIEEDIIKSIVRGVFYCQMKKYKFFEEEELEEQFRLKYSETSLHIDELSEFIYETGKFNVKEIKPILKYFFGSSWGYDVLDRWSDMINEVCDEINMLREKGV